MGVRGIDAIENKRKASGRIRRRAMLKTQSMATSVLIEICVESLEHAVAAERAGADRIELCHDLACGGLTPSGELIRAVRRRVQIPLHVLIRPRPGNFCYSAAEFVTMQQAIDAAKDFGLDGIVLGLLDPFETVDLERTRTLVERAHPLPVTFHRAFDECPDLMAALEAVIETGARRILTSGGTTSVMEGLASLAHLVRAAGNRTVIMPGGGIRSDNVERILQTTGAREIHSSLGGSQPNSIDAASFEERVRKFRSAVENAG